MTVATALRACAEIVAPLTGWPVARVLVAIGGLGQLAGALLFVANMWSRVRMPAVPPPAR
jgi:hypothetical protein